MLGGSRAAGQSLYQGSTTYTFGGSALDTAPYQLRPDVPVNQPPFTTNNFGATFGGPVKIPGLYANNNGRTNFQVNYMGNQSSVVFDQYATVPDEAMRRGDFSQSSFALVDPKTGQAFPNNQIPATQIDPVGVDCGQLLVSEDVVRLLGIGLSSHGRSSACKFGPWRR